MRSGEVRLRLRFKVRVTGVREGVISAIRVSVLIKALIKVWEILALHVCEVMKGNRQTDRQTDKQIDRQN